MGGAAEPEDEVEQALRRSAVGYTERVLKSYKVKRVEYDDAGKRKCEFEEIVQGTDEKYVPPSVSAQQFWLRNRAPDRWGAAAEAGEPGMVELPPILDDPEADGDG